jgi:cysteinyl-tRNA synthetase
VAFLKGRTFPLSLLREADAAGTSTEGRPVPAQPALPADEQAAFWQRLRGLEADFAKALADHEPHAATRALLDVDDVVWRASQDLANRDTVSQAREMLRDMIVMLGARLNELPPSTASCLAPLVERLLEVRNRCKDLRQWAHADAIREALLQADVVVEDTGKGPRWRVDTQRP